jgi:branched-chain amino acid aminotransferase
MDGIAFVEGSYVPIAEARVPMLDWGFLHSDATYDVVHVWRGSFFRLQDHLTASCAVSNASTSGYRSNRTASRPSSRSAFAAAACGTRTSR